jgi:hypothetical protein
MLCPYLHERHSVRPGDVVAVDLEEVKEEVLFAGP